MNNFDLTLSVLKEDRIDESLITAAIFTSIGTQLPKLAGTITPFLAMLGGGVILAGNSVGTPTLATLGLGKVVAGMAAGTAMAIPVTVGLAVLAASGYITKKIITAIYRKVRDKRYFTLLNKLLDNPEFIKDAKSLDINLQSPGSKERKLIKNLMKKHNIER